MHFTQLFTPGLAHCSYVIGGKKECLVVDPPRDIQRCLEAAKSFGLPITGIIETHLHADFVSGHMDLAQATGATIYVAQSAQCAFEHVPLSEGQRVQHDTFRLELIDTPGHTPEGAIFLVSDLQRSDDPILVFSGDTLLVGDVGRPDLFPDRKEELAHKLYRSLRKIEELGDNLELYPAHGMGSLCGRSLSAKLSSTVGSEKRYNYAFSLHPEDTFKRSLLHGMPEAPDHFARCSEINRQGPPLVTGLKMPRPLHAKGLWEEAGRGHVVLDIREQSGFVAGHIPGSYCIPIRSNFSTFAGWVIPPDLPILLVADSLSEIDEAIIKLRRVGLDRVDGFLKGGIDEWVNQGMPMDNLQSMSVHLLKERLCDTNTLYVDTRMRGEWEEGHIEGTLHGPTPDLRHLFEDLPFDHPIVVFCSTSKRSILGASILKRRGFRQVTQVLGGVTAWKNAGYPLVTGR